MIVSSQALKLTTVFISASHIFIFKTYYFNTKITSIVALKQLDVRFEESVEISMHRSYKAMQIKAVRANCLHEWSYRPFYYVIGHRIYHVSHVDRRGVPPC